MDLMGLVVFVQVKIGCREREEKKKLQVGIWEIYVQIEDHRSLDGLWSFKRAARVLVVDIQKVCSLRKFVDN